ncbi:hypothetical protein ZYGR_0H00490 [Zygosaccharomyces rouxii]|uniref:ZYRO0B05126p n=2 Tax=Zygosaccharomyces rouxii TaxID=4956 RepID=C5DR30_ZYGRC|nr:uncharacterized protein ZYRO0B05126g [Zygosaccharomyces rouxii]KAH9200213.1 helix-loop-helix DNA-binding domain-containing protein [Zygosaccharomyces rouxii]GAV47208.1 hypothetical protein ZYGR_0H00490 [Zygosaccharomyces rouxii]CAR26241.1 ZYRO0B05126p [Zygosaccharomyces rouxii]
MNGSVPSSVQSSNSISKVDRRRRDNINDRIQQLLTMIPQEFFQEYNRSNNDSETSLLDTPVSGTPKESSIAKAKSTGTKDGKPNKGQILTQTVEYINALQNQVDSNNREEAELIFKVQELSKKTGTIINDVNLENTSAEVALSKIGVGPLAGNTDEPLQSVSPQLQASSVAASTVPGSIPAPQNSSRSTKRTSGFEYGGYTEYS